MKATITHRDRTYGADLSEPIDISIPLRGGEGSVTAWYLPPPAISPVREGDFTASVAEGGAVNSNTIVFNPHAHGTHTECLGHITAEFYSVNAALKAFFAIAELITVAPGRLGGDFVISEKQLRNALRERTPEAVVIRTLPNDNEKLSRQYSNTNPPYLMKAAAVYLRETGVKHLLIDLPSVDKEKDGGALPAHRAFWNMDGEMRTEATITELIYVPNTVADGSYLLNLQIAPFENDATPAKPVLYALTEITAHRKEHP